MAVAAAEDVDVGFAVHLHMRNPLACRSCWHWQSISIARRLQGAAEKSDGNGARHA